MTLWDLLRRGVWYAVGSWKYGNWNLVIGNWKYGTVDGVVDQCVAASVGPTSCSVVAAVPTSSLSGLMEPGTWKYGNWQLVDGNWKYGTVD